MSLIEILFLFLTITSAWAQFLLPQVPQDPPKAKIPSDLADYFSIRPGRQLVNSILPGFVPPPNYEIEGETPDHSVLNGLSINRVDSNGLPSDLSAFLRPPSAAGKPGENRSSVAGIPDIFPTLPNAPVPKQQQQSLGNLPSLSNVQQAQQSGLGSILAGLTGGQPNPVGFSPPFGGFGPQGFSSGSGFNPSSIQSQPPNPFAPGPLFGSGFGQQSQIPQVPQPGAPSDSLITQLLRSLGLSEIAPGLDVGPVTSALANPQNGDVLSSVLYSALTDGSAKSISKNDTQQVARANAAVIQNLLTQPSSPLCNPKPQPVRNFNLDAFMGKFYQVLYSPPMSLGPCSMIVYNKLSEVGNGGPGTMFNLFEYTTQGTPKGQPLISSGYGMVRAPGEMTFRTSSNPNDLMVYVLETGPLNKKGQYEYVILAVNCNYPIYVYARDPVDFKQRYEPEVNGFLQQRGLATSWARLFNIVAPVDYNLCNLPPTLFNVNDG